MVKVLAIKTGDGGYLVWPPGRPIVTSDTLPFIEIEWPALGTDQPASQFGSRPFQAKDTAATPLRLKEGKSTDMATQATTAAAPAHKPAKKASASRRKKAARAAQAASARPDGLRAGSKMATMIDMTLRTKGATEAEICEAIGWKKCRVTLTRAAAKANYDLTHEKNDKGEVVWKSAPKPTK